MPPLAILDDHNSLPILAYHSSPPQTRLPPFHKSLHNQWDSSKSSSLYRIHAWGAPYFSVSAAGTMVVQPHGCKTEPHEEIDIFKVVKKVISPKSKGGLGLSVPTIIRFPHILHDRVRQLQSSFDDAIKANGYGGCYQGVYPVKCNQDRYVVETIVEVGKAFAFGLEAGSKPELLLAMTALCKGSPQALLVCNGYKDAEYIRLALLSRKIGLNCVIVLEQVEELDLVLSVSRKLSIDPVIGLRAKLSTKHGGHFGDTSGEKGKFGLSSKEIIHVVKKLQLANKLGCLQLLHFHIGSQIPSLTVLNDGVSEAAHIYCELALMGASMKYIDVGGGLGIDYDGSNSASSDLSVGYTMEQYASEVVQAVSTACAIKGVKQLPTLCSESGRALISHHSVLVFNVFSSSGKSTCTHMEKGVSLEIDDLPPEMKDVHSALLGHARACDYGGALEYAKVLKQCCTELFKQGRFGLSQLAAVSDIYDTMSAAAAAAAARTDVTKCRVSRNYSASLAYKPASPDAGEEIAGADADADADANAERWNATYHINLSIFRSIPDKWAIGQLFPIVPLHRLDEEPTVQATLSDLTCDSDGKITSFIGMSKRGERPSCLRVHELEGKPYYMGLFLGGAYQETLGCMHNLFGEPSVVSVTMNDVSKTGVPKFKVCKISGGQAASDVLRMMRHEPSEMIEALSTYIKGSPNLHDHKKHHPVSHDLVMRHVTRAFASSTYLGTSGGNLVSSPTPRASTAPLQNPPSGSFSLEELTIYLTSLR